MSATQQMPLPVIDADSQEYWAAAARHEFKLPYCNGCNSHFFYPRALCPNCHSDDIEWRTASGKGVIYSYTISRRPAGPAFKDEAPYVVALVDLAEGPRMLSNIVVDDISKVRIGQEVKVTFKDVAEGVSLPVFELATA